MLRTTISQTFRRLVRSPARAVFNSLVLGGALGLSVALFAGLFGLFYSEVPVDGGSELHAVHRTDPNSGPMNFTFSEFRRLARITQPEAVLIGWQGRSVPLSLHNQRGPKRALTLVAPGFLEAGFLPISIGRLPSGVHKEREIVVSPRIASSFGLTGQEMIGAEVAVLGSNYVVVGVTEKGFGFPFRHDAWLLGSPHWQDETPIQTFLRLEGRSGIAAISKRMEGSVRQNGVDNQDVRVVAYPYRSFYAPEGIATLHRLVLAVMLIVLLIGTVNTAAIATVDTVRRGPELSVRHALGASPKHLLAGCLTEALATSLAAGLVGYVISILLVAAYSAKSGALYGAYWAVVDFNEPVLLFGTLLLGLVGGVSCVVPAASVMSKLRKGGFCVGGTQRRFTQRRLFPSFAMLQIIVANLLLLTTGCILFRLLETVRGDHGFDTTNLLVASVSSLPQDAHATNLYSKIERELALVPGIQEAALVCCGAPGEMSLRQKLTVDETKTAAWVQVISPGYLRTLGLSTFAGRSFDERDAAAQPPVALVNASFNSRYFGNQWEGQSVIVEGRAREVVGIVPDFLVPHPGGTKFGSEAVFLPLTQRQVSTVTVLARLDGQARSNVQTSLRVRLMDSLRDDFVSEPTFLTNLLLQGSLVQTLAGIALASLSFVTLLLAVGGVVATAWFAATEKKTAFAIRLALGAQPSSIATNILLNVATFSGLGSLVGCSIFVPVFGALSRVTPESVAWHPFLLVVPFLIVLGSILGTLGFARRAWTLNPSERLFN